MRVKAAAVSCVEWFVGYRTSVQGKGAVAPRGVDLPPQRPKAAPQALPPALRARPLNRGKENPAVPARSSAAACWAIGERAKCDGCV